MLKDCHQHATLLAGIETLSNSVYWKEHAFDGDIKTYVSSFSPLVHQDVNWPTTPSCVLHQNVLAFHRLKMMESSDH